jgi:hypothetical protein
MYKSSKFQNNERRYSLHSFSTGSDYENLRQNLYGSEEFCAVSQ